MFSIRSLFFLALPLAFVGAKKLKIELEPALSYHESIPDGDVLFFRVVKPVPFDEGCTLVCVDDNSSPPTCETVCGGGFSADLSQVDGIDFSFKAVAGGEIYLRHPVDSPRIRVEFAAEAEGCKGGDFDFKKKVKEAKVDIQGSKTDQLVANFDQKNSFLEVTDCMISTRLEFSSKDTVFEGKVSKLSWSVAFEGGGFDKLKPKDYFFGTNGYSWIRTPFDGSIIPPFVETGEKDGTNTTTAPTISPTETDGTNTTTAPTISPTSMPSGAPITDSPSMQPVTNAPVADPITIAPTDAPTATPTDAPTAMPTDEVSASSQSFLLFNALLVLLMALFL